MTRVDDILALIDTGLQTAGDIAYGNDGEGLCWRCRMPGDDLCDRCRGELLEEVEPGQVTGKSITVIVGLDLPAFHAALDDIAVLGGQSNHDVFRRLVDQYVYIVDERIHPAPHGDIT